MKKLLLLSTALAGLTMMSASASAGVDYKWGGYVRGYLVSADNNLGSTFDERNFAPRQDSELHFNVNATLDSGLTVGYHGEIKTLDPFVVSSLIDESYAYFSGGWGRINFGSSEGAAYLLQVAAPSADSNIDGMRVQMQALQAKTSQTAGAGSDQSSAQWNYGDVLGLARAAMPVLDYQHADYRQSERLTYMTPKFNGFQAGVSYAEFPGMAPVGSNLVGNNLINGGLGLTQTYQIAAPKDLWEVSARWDGEFQGFGIALGGGYSDSGVEATATNAQVQVLGNQEYYINDGIKTWNGGANLAFQGFSLGGNYKRTATSRIADARTGNAAGAVTGDITRNTYDVGLGYDNGPWHAGASYLNQTTKYDGLDSAASNQEISKSQFKNTKYTVGGGYTYGPGMTFRGAVAWGKFDVSGGNVDPDGANTAWTSAADNRFTQVTVGTNVAF